MLTVDVIYMHVLRSKRVQGYAGKVLDGKWKTEIKDTPPPPGAFKHNKIQFVMSTKKLNLNM